MIAATTTATTVTATTATATVAVTAATIATATAATTADDRTPPADEFGDDSFIANNLDEIDAIINNVIASPERQPSPAKKARYPNPGATTYNRKEGRRSIPSPLDMTVQEPLSAGQIEKASSALADLSVNASPKQISTATGTARALRTEWNRQYSSSLMHEQPSQALAGTMPAGVARKIVTGMVTTQVRVRAEESVTIEASAPPVEVQPAKKRGRPRKQQQPVIPIEEVS